MIFKKLLVEISGIFTAEANNVKAESSIVDDYLLVINSNNISFIYKFNDKISELDYDDMLNATVKSFKIISNTLMLP